MEFALSSSLALAAKGPVLPGTEGMNSLQLIMLIAAIGGLTLILLSTRRKMRTRAAGSRATVRDRYSELSRQTKTKQDGEQVVVELDRISREIHARIDTKFAKLDAVIRDADERIDQLNRLLLASSGGSTCDVTVTDETRSRPAAEVSSPPTVDTHDPIYSLADSGLSALQIAEKTGRPTGEIELILALRRTRDAVSKPVAHA